MPIVFWTLLVAGLLPVLTVSLAKAGARDFDNHDPRAWLERQSGLRKRADAAHRNHFEAFPFFAAAVLSAYALQAPLFWLNLLGLVFLGLRLLYTGFYLYDQASLRTLSWALGYLVVIGIFTLPVWAG